LYDGLVCDYQVVDQSFQTYPQLLRNVQNRDRRKAGNTAKLCRVIAISQAAMGDQGRILSAPLAQNRLFELW